MRALLGLVFWGVCAVGSPLPSPAVSPVSPSDDPARAGFLWSRLWKAGSGELIDVESTLPAEDAVSRALVDLALHQALLREGRVHAARESADRLAQVCEGWEGSGFQDVPESQRARAAFVCASDYGARLGSAGPFSRLRLAGRLRGALLQSQLEKISPLERYAAEARIYAFLPPGQGQDFGRSLLALNILERSAPRLDGTRDLFTRVYQVQRNFLGLKTRALPTRQDRAGVDGIAYGVSPVLFASPLRGVGGGLAWRDERLGDTDRQIELGAWAATRGAVGGAFAYSDAESTLLRLESRLDFTDGQEDFFGIGMDASQREIFTARRVGARAGARLGPELGLQFSGGVSATTVVVRNEAPPALKSVYHLGPYLEVAFDTRDSRYFPRHGSRYAVMGYAPLGQDFGVLQASALQFFEIGWRQALSFSASYQAALGTPPVLAYPRVSAPGLRDGRFTDRHTLSLGAEYKRLVVGPVTAGVFGGVLSASSDLDRLPRSRWLPGFGGVVEYAFSAYSRPRARVEIGVYGGETALAFAAGTSF